MKINRLKVAVLFLGMLSVMGCTEHPTAIITIDKETLMNEVRVDVSPLDGARATTNPPRFMWPDKFPHLGPVLDGVPGHVDVKPSALYRIRIARDKGFTKNLFTGEKAWAFFNPFCKMEKGEWYW